MAFCPVTHRAAALPTASFDSSVRKVLCNPHQAAMDVKKPAELVLYGLSRLYSWRSLNNSRNYLL
ncbi:hypothetical protein DMA36_22235 [Salmonella enterica subsp. enterica serovar Newport]|nr:hypothetical protein [Salmonella enterica subsp. enterica serovar Newport]